MAFHHVFTCFHRVSLGDFLGIRKNHVVTTATRLKRPPFWRPLGWSPKSCQCTGEIEMMVMCIYIYYNIVIYIIIIIYHIYIYIIIIIIIMYTYIYIICVLMMMYTMWGPQDSIQLVVGEHNSNNYGLWYWGAYKPTYNWGASHCIHTHIYICIYIYIYIYMLMMMYIYNDMCIIKLYDIYNDISIMCINIYIYIYIYRYLCVMMIKLIYIMCIL